MKKQLIFPLFIIMASTACNDESASIPISENIEHFAGGSATAKERSADAFSNRSENMTDINHIRQFNLGDDFFENPWVAGSASTSSRDGLGGVFNNNACQDCHIRDGRGHAPNAGESDFSSILFRAARANISNDQQHKMQTSMMANVGDTAVGGQLQQDAVSGVLAEVDLAVTYLTTTFEYSDGQRVVMRKPQWTYISKRADQGYNFDADTVFSARISPPMHGLGLLAQIDESVIIANEDINDANGDGISGKANRVWSIESNQVTLGRFGWKAGQPSLLEQAAGAFVNDMGLTNRLHQDEACLSHQLDCQNTANGNGDSVADYPYEVPDKVLDAIAFYSANLAVPLRVNAYDKNVQRGKALFTKVNCSGCHIASYTTNQSSEFPELSEQVIFPYTDMLLHDMGAELADVDIENNAASGDVLYEFLATAREWRTTPLWGIGLTQVVNPKAGFLHDGRALTIEEAILWHGGEASKSKEAFTELTAVERIDLLDFVRSL